ncbi:MAG TPA: OmpA family protein [Sphingobacteriaceae bacterium]
MYDDEEPRKSRWWLWLIIPVLAVVSILVFRTYQNRHKISVAVDSTSFATGDDVWETASFEVTPLQFDEITSSGILVKGNKEYAVYTLFPFDAGKITLRPDAYEKLQQIVKSIADRFETGRIRIYSFSDSTGSVQANLELTKARAEAVRNWLVYEGGVPVTSVSIFPSGESKPIAPNATPEGRRLNRRIEIVALLEDAATKK